MRMRNLLVAAVVFLGVHLAARTASAGYVCYVNYNPASNLYPSYGSEGYVTLAEYDQPECEGDSTVWYFCTTGSTNTSCSTWRYERHGVLAVYHALVEAAIRDARISVNSANCNGGSPGCATRPYVYSD